MKLIALDVGTKRIGVAKADSAVKIAVPYSAVEVDGSEYEKIASLARAWGINCFVVGLPRNASGEETEQSQYSRQFAKTLKQALPDAKICFQDESLTSVEAEKRLKGRKKGVKKGDIDSEAAAIILQDFLEEHMGGKTKKSVTKASGAKHRSVQGHKPHKFLTVFLVIIIILGVTAGAGFVYITHNLKPVYPDVDCKVEENKSLEACKEISFVVEDGSGVDQIANDLKQAGLIRDALVFRFYYQALHLTNKADSIKSGTFNLTRAMAPDKIIEVMSHGSDDHVFSFTIFPGENLQEIKAKLVKQGYSAEEIDAAFSANYRDKDYGWMFEGRPDDASLEGYIYGDTYEFYNSDDVEKIVDTALLAMSKTIEKHELKQKFEAHGLNLYQGITLASIVQREANNPTDWAKVAQVFYNRLAQDISLGSDVTVQYAVNLVDPNREVYTDNALALEIDSPYNTRKYKGLPYGPVDNPGLEALLATASPDESAKDFIFFLTGDDGLMYYSITDEEHQQNIQDHCESLCNVSL